jgi:hypothetical protein
LSARKKRSKTCGRSAGEIPMPAESRSSLRRRPAGQRRAGFPLSLPCGQSLPARCKSNCVPGTGVTAPEGLVSTRREGWPAAFAVHVRHRRRSAGYGSAHLLIVESCDSKKAQAVQSRRESRAPVAARPTWRCPICSARSERVTSGCSGSFISACPAIAAASRISGVINRR